MRFEVISSETTYPKEKEILFDNQQLDVLVKNELIYLMADKLRNNLRTKTIYEPENDIVKVIGELTLEVPNDRI